jgi:hypothetical protein
MLVLHKNVCSLKTKHPECHQLALPMLVQTNQTSAYQSVCALVRNTHAAQCIKFFRLDSREFLVKDKSPAI